MTMLTDLKRIRTVMPLLSRLTVREAIKAGDQVIDACGLNPWCMSEGTATGNEPAISAWKIRMMMEAVDRVIAALEASDASAA